ncbi:MAG: cytochrome c3 family protein [Candidatus Omnitrophica bacterium]|nr:cytochrome c3 family protein [Candidatus Omnitrophota bacterium]
MDHDVHIQRGLSCADCHGGDPTATDQSAAMDPARGFIGRPLRQEIPQFCARCHADPAYMRKYNPNLPTDQYAKYLTSQHGKRFAQGDSDVAVCTSCHEAHGIRSKNDPLSPVFATHIPGTCATCHTDATLMERHGLPVTQHWEYAQSVHGQALLFRGDRAAPHCASCHGSHEAAKPGVIAIGNVCAQCHSLTRDLFAKSPHKAAHEALGLPECEVCHGNHLIRKPTDEMLGVGADALCVRCHEPGSEGFVTAQQMREAIERLKTEVVGAKEIVSHAANLGMDTADAEFALHEAASQLTQARTYVHSFSFPMMEPIAAEGIRHTRQAKEQGRQAVHEFHFRRQGLWTTLVILALVIIGIVLMIREMEQTRSKRNP